MSEIDLLLKKTQESIGAAQALFEQSYPDFAASRAYYALFYVAQALLLAKGQTYSSHAAVIAAFGKEYAKTKVLDPKFHRHLILAQSERNVGDYGVGENVASEDAAKLIGWAREFLQAARQYLNH